MRQLLRDLAGEIIPEKAVELAREGRKGDALALLRIPKRTSIEAELEEAARGGWAAGLLEAGVMLERLGLPAPDPEDDREDDYDEPLPGAGAERRRLRQLRARESRRVTRGEARRLPPVDYRPTRAERAAMPDEADRAARSLRRILLDLLSGQRVPAEDRARLRTDDPEELAQVMAILRDGGRGSERVLRAIQLERRDVTAAVAEVDWQAFQRAHLERTRADAAITAYQWVSARDESVTCVCRAFDAQLIAADDPELMMYAPRIHYGCFVPGTVVEGDVIGGLRAFYSGQVVELETASGRRVTVTPQHPILTQHGFVEASELRQGDYVVTHGGVVETDSASPIAAPSLLDDEQHEPARIEQVFRAFRQGWGASAVDVGALDLDGDEAGVEGDVDVVGSYRELLLHSDPSRAQSLRQSILEVSAAPQATGIRAGSLDLLPSGLLAPRRGCPGCTTLPLGARPPLIGGQSANGIPLPRLRIGLAANVNASRYQATADRAAIDPVDVRQLVFGGAGHVSLDHVLDGNLTPVEDLGSTLDESGAQRFVADTHFLRQLRRAGAGLVSVDQVTDLRWREFSGHVYDLQTSTGWLSANGIVASNCRCAFFPRTVADRVSLTWDDIQTFTVAEGTGKRRRLVPLTAAPRDFEIPGSKPNQPPPRQCSDWLRRGRPRPAGQLKSQAQLERDFRRQERERRARHVGAIAGS